MIYYVIKVTHEDDTGGNIIFTDKDEANKVVKFLTEKYKDTGSSISTGQVEQ